MDKITKTKKKIPCEIFSRVVGYMRPLNQWNPGKRSEFADRKYYKIDGDIVNERKNN